ncbi:MAG: PKD domain-containing protein [Candidatus Omnitrophica bacterium]|nr:PKD domain-containing protein [Candidatus Omnitrophota bacterium]
MKKKIILIISAILFLSGCATYKVQKGKAPYDQGYVVVRKNKILPEYTVGSNNSVPDKQIAEERFHRRRKTVEYYYKKLGYIENSFKGMFVDPPTYLIKTIFGLFSMPVIAVKDYKYNHSPKYKEKVDQFDEIEYKAEKEHIKEIKDKLNAYIQEDLKKEPVVNVGVAAPVLIPTPALVSSPVLATAPTAEPAPSLAQAPPSESALAPEPVLTPVQAVPEETKETVTTPVIEEKVVKEVVPTIEVKPQVSYIAPVAVITAKPMKGASPFTVQFSGARSYSSKSKIVAYLWDFGDGDTSARRNPSNTYWSTSYGSRIFTATLTVTDNLGQSAATSINIEVVTK